MSFFPLTLLFAALVTFTLGNFVFFKDPGKKLNRLFMLFCTFSAYASFTQFERTQAENYAEAFLWVKIGSFWPLLQSLLLHFVLIFSEKVKLLKKIWIYPLIYIPSMIASFLFLTTNLFINGLTKKPWGWNPIRPENSISQLIPIWFSGIGILTVYLSFRYYQKTTDPIKKQQAKYITLGLFISIMMAFLSEGLFPALKINLPKLSPHGILLETFFVGYAIWRYKLFILSSATAGEKIVSTMADALFLVSLDGKIQKLNQAALKLLGYKGSELISQPFSSIVADEKKPSLKALQLGQLAVTSSLSDLEIVFTRKDSQKIPVSVSASVVRDACGARQGIVYICRDLTERKLAEEELKKLHGHLEQRVEERTAELAWANQELQQEILERKRIDEALRDSEQWANSILQSMLAGVLVIDAETHKIVDANPLAVQMIGLSRERIIGSICHSFICLAEQGKCPVSDLGQKVDSSERVLITGSGYKIPILKSVTEVTHRSRKYFVEYFLDITEQKRAEEQIKAALAEKELLLKEIHHRVKNNMQIMSSLLSLQSRYVKDQMVREMFKESQSRIRSMAFVHEKLYQSHDFSRIEFSDYIRSLVSHQFHSCNIDPSRIRLRMDVQEVFLDINTAIPCGLIVNELISNSLKHAFPHDRGGEIVVGLYQAEDHRIVLIVKDTGVGFPENLDFRNTESLGMQLVKILVDQLEGSIELSRQEGTEFKIVFQKLKYGKRV